MDIYAAGVAEDAFEGSDMDMSSSDSEAEEVPHAFMHLAPDAHA